MRGEAYARLMRDRLRSTYFSTFGGDLHPEDLEHCFALAREERLPLGSERISELLIQMRAALDGIEACVDIVYRRVLLRPADAEERRENVQRFRAEEFEDLACKRLAVELHGSLEFLDVVKTTIASAYLEKHLRDIRPKQLFEALAAVMSEHGGNMAHWVIPAL